MHSILDSVQFSPIECELMGQESRLYPLLTNTVNYRSLLKFAESCRNLLGQLSLASLRGRLIEYQLRLG